MKKLSLIIVAITVISLVACKKDRVCTCTESTPGSTPEKVTLVKVTKRQAKANCVSTQETFNGTTTKNDCKLD
jgi:hypothetical protein